MELHDLLKLLISKGVKIREVPVSTASLVESAANTYTPITVSLSSHFTQREREAGLMILGADIKIGQLSDSLAASDYARTCVQITKTVQTTIIGIDDSDLLIDKALEGMADANKALYSQEAHTWPKGGVVSPTRQFAYDRDDEDIHLGIKSAFQGAAKAASVIIYVAVGPLA